MLKYVNVSKLAMLGYADDYGYDEYDEYYDECYNDGYDYDECYDECYDEVSETVHGFFATFDDENLNDDDVDEAFAEYLKSKLAS